MIREETKSYRFLRLACLSKIVHFFTPLSFEETFESNVPNVTKIAMLIVAYTPSLIPQLLANQYASWRKIDYVTTFDFFFLFFHPSTLSLPPFPPFQRERKLGGEEWRGREGEREGENKSPSVWLSPALSRLSNRGLRSSLLFNLSTE